ncbi:hypothetical protein BDN72DRAFT_54721 [Pluteus cervinus]|uniref:Uncharacterized protein n=1 Tax=Pluteus cervinus TaxID=181527 RepID=A0ACD3B8G7_9AGAR|nr:hypothetical protein BDN72DRAFT_54721 [Pluteus cervinus]
MQDPRMIDVLGVLMGIDMQGFSRPEGSDELPPGVRTSSPPTSPPPPSAASSSAPKSEPKSRPPPPPAQEDVEMEDIDDDEAKAKKEAEAAKKLGGEAYKKRNFEEAVNQFEKAWDLWPKDITYLTNAGGKCRFVKLE